MPELTVEVDIRRPPAVVRSWWLDLPEVYEADDPLEQPHRIEKVTEDDQRMELRTYWRGPFGSEMAIEETIHLGREDGWTIDVGLPAGLAQEDIFTLRPTDTGTRVTIDVSMWAERWYGYLALPFFWLFGRINYPKTWRTAAKLCERATEPET